MDRLNQEQNDSEKYTIAVEAAPKAEDNARVNAILDAYNARQMDASDYKPLTILLRDSENEIVGGLIGSMYWDWLYVETLAIEETARQSGNGGRLLAQAEQEAVAYGCRFACLDTFSFQALPFYQKQGYEIFGTLDNCPGEQKRYYLRKALT